MRTLTRFLGGHHPGPESAIFKVYWSEYHRKITELAVEILGMDALVPDGRRSKSAFQTDDVGAPNSSNSKRLVEVGSAAGCGYSQLIQRAADIDWRALEGIGTVGVTAGASAPELLVNEVIDAFRARYATTVELVETAQEHVEFKVPRVLRSAEG